MNKIAFTIFNSLIILGVVGLLLTVHTNTAADSAPIKLSSIKRNIDKFKRFTTKLTKVTTNEQNIKINSKNPEAASKLISSLAPEYVMVNSSDSTTFSSETAATVILISSKEGDSFRAGDILVEFDCRVQRADLKKAKAQQESANSALKSAEKMESYGSISQFELIKARTEASVAAAEVDKLSALVDKCIIKAPYNGAVSSLAVHVGETVKPGDQILKILNNENLELQLQIPSSWLQWLHIGSSFNVIINETNKNITARISKINPEIDSVSQTVKVVGVPESSETSLLPGMSGQAEFQEVPSNNKQSNGA